MKQKLITLLATMMLTSIAFTGCGNQNSADTKTTKETNKNKPTITETMEKSFEFRPIVDSLFYENAYSKNHMQTFKNMMNALLTYKNEFAIEEGVEWWEVEEFTNYMFPAFEIVVEQIEQKDSKGYIIYKNDKETTNQLIEAFAEKVEWWINSCTKQDEPDMLKAMEIYHKMSKEVSYDYEALNEDSIADVSPYHAIMESAGICQSFAPAYSYLLMQLGIDACPTGGLCTDNVTSHEWTLLKLCDKWFYADVTYENTDSGNRLLYFGMTAKKRSEEGDYPIELMNIGECNRVFGNDIDITDDRFACLAEIYDVKKMTYDNNSVIVEGLDFNNIAITVKIPTN